MLRSTSRCALRVSYIQTPSTTARFLTMHSHSSANNHSNHTPLPSTATATHPQAASCPTAPPPSSSRVLVLTGPTSVGKSSTALSVCALLNGEVISADSVQLYRQLDIGSNKATVDERARVPHHLLDVVDPDMEDTYSAGDFFRAARAATADVLARAKLPVVVGGTMMYVRWYLRGPPATPKAGPGARLKATELIADAQAANDWDAALAVLQERDPVRAARLNRNDWYRLVRALEVFHTSGGVPMTDMPLIGAAPQTEFVMTSTTTSTTNTSEHRQQRQQQNNTNSSTNYQLQQGQPSVSNSSSSPLPKHDPTETETETKLSAQTSAAKPENERGNEHENQLDFRCVFLYPEDRIEMNRGIDLRCEHMILPRSTGLVANGDGRPVVETSDEYSLVKNVAAAPGEDDFDDNYLNTIPSILCEVARLLVSHKLRVAPGTPCLAIGYRQTIVYLLHRARRRQQQMQGYSFSFSSSDREEGGGGESEGEDEEEMAKEAFRSYVDEFQQATRTYAKQQMAWFRKDPKFQWVSAGGASVTSSANVDDSSIDSTDDDNNAASPRNAAAAIADIVTMSCSDYDALFTDDESRDRQNQIKDGLIAQGRSMKTYIARRTWLVDGSAQEQRAIALANRCARDIARQIEDHEIERMLHIVR